MHLTICYTEDQNKESVSQFKEETVEGNEEREKEKESKQADGHTSINRELYMFDRIHSFL